MRFVEALGETPRAGECMSRRMLTKDEIEAVKAKARARAKARRPTAIVDISVDPMTDSNGMPVVRISYLGDRLPP